MAKLISLIKRKEGMSQEEFARWAVESHALIGKRMPGIRQYRINVRGADQPEEEFDGVFELWFDTAEALKAAFDSPVGAEARDDAVAHASKRVHLHIEEHVIVQES
ncbi:MAG TPA: EthD family reductase [Ktedonobacteraceae bacterium]|jgi:uncharacterized protein (TIGR02118 family)|nr:EthD family reductase [Ktedonobacteraceae bacterium]